MRTSNKFIFSALLLTLMALVVYDLLLKAEYRSGNYKIPYQNYVGLNFRNFDVLDLNSSTVANVRLVQGPFSVRINENALEYVKVQQKGNHLQIDAGFEDQYYGNPNPYLLVISCPKLTSLNADASYQTGDGPYTDSIAREDWNMRRVLIDGFIQDSLQISADYGSTVVLANNHIRSLHAVIGKSRGSGSGLIIQNTNRFQDAVLDIRHKSKLQLENAMIDNLHYDLGDSAQLLVSGKAQNLLSNSKPDQK
ncbi:MAG TPA: hypothetical protein VGM24_02655 [Puia sp.]|jgi:hypothetical protein